MLLNMWNDLAEATKASDGKKAQSSPLCLLTLPLDGPRYHYGYYTLKDRLVQFHEPKHVPSDAEAVLEWGLNTPFNSQDKPPLAIATVVTVNGVRSLKRYRLNSLGQPKRVQKRTENVPPVAL